MEQVMYLFAGLLGIGIAIGSFTMLIQYVIANNKEEHQCNCRHCHDEDGDRE